MSSNDVQAKFRKLLDADLTNIGAPQLDLKINAEKPETVKEGRKIRHMNRVFMLILFAMLVVSLVTIFALGTNVYRALAQARAEGEQVRLQTALIATSIRSNDEFDAAVSGKGPEGPALVLQEHVDGDVYETRLYQYQGELMQEYAVRGAAYDPTRATAVCENQQFAFRIADGLVTIATDAGQTRVALRSGGGEQQ